MPQFQYSGTNTSGKRVSDVVTARDKRSAVRVLQKQRIVPIQIKEVVGAEPKSAGSGVTSSKLQKKATAKTPPTRKRTEKKVGLLQSLGRSKTSPADGSISGNEILGLKFAKRLLELHSGGMSLGDAVFLLSQRLSEPKLKRITAHVWSHLREGRSFAKAAESVPRLFPRAMLPLFEAGEASGDMKSILQNCIEYIEERRALKKRILASLSYPAVLICLVIVIMIGFMYFLVPTIQSMIDSMGGKMNFFTATLINVSDFLLKGGPFILIGIVIGVIFLLQWRRTEKGRLLTDKWLLKLPLIGLIAESSALYQISNLMTTLMESGINTSENLKLSERTIQNQWLKTKFSNARTMIIEGASFSVAFKQNNLYTDASIDVLTVGENTGSLEKGLREITNSVRNLLDDKLKLLTVLISSGAMATAFIMVMFAALGMVLSVLEVSQTISLR